jgi:cyclase
MGVRLLGASGVMALTFLVPLSAAAAELERLSDAVAMLVGKSGNVLIVAGPTGTLLIDDQRRSDAIETEAGARQLSPMPIRMVINTHWHLDHSDGNEVFGKQGASVIAHRNVRLRRATEQYMAAYKARIPPASDAALPTVLYDEKMELLVGGETVKLRHAANAHTDGDTIVMLEKANVIHMGDIFFNGIFPFIDRSSNGSIQGMIAGVDQALAMADDHTRIVPAHGKIATKAELAAYRAMLDDVADKVGRAMKAGKSRAEIIAMMPASGYRNGMEGNEDRFVEAIYDSLAP